MTHLSLEDIYEIARMADAGIEPDDGFKEKIAHIQGCDKCFKLYTLEYSIIKETEPIGILKTESSSAFATFKVIKNTVQEKISAIQEYAQDISWQFEYKPSFAGARSLEESENDNKTVLQNVESKYSQIIIKGNIIRILIENDGRSYMTNCITNVGKQYTADFVYDEYEDMLVAELKDISEDEYTLNIIESDK